MTVTVEALPRALTASLLAAGARQYIDRAGTLWSLTAAGTRYVRTSAGAARYGVPIGSPIPSGGSSRARSSRSSSADSDAPSGSRRPRAAAAPEGAQSVRLPPAQARIATRIFPLAEAGEGPRRGAVVTRNRIDVTNPERATARIDEYLRTADVDALERLSLEALRRRVAALRSSS